jgi:hypothetical protein
MLNSQSAVAVGAALTVSWALHTGSATALLACIGLIGSAQLALVALSRVCTNVCHMVGYAG